MTDIHSHILYGLDDGAGTRADSERMLKAAQAVGIERMIATPHARHQPVDIALAEARRDELQAPAEAAGIQLDLGFELHWNVLLALSEAEYAQYCMGDTHTLLLEFSLTMNEAPQGHEQMIYRLQRGGIQVIIAHPERYPFVQKRPSIADRWRDLGCALQCDAICLKHGYEPGSKRTARLLFERGVYDYFASDAHCADDYKRFGKAMEWVERHR